MRLRIPGQKSGALHFWLIVLVVAGALGLGFRESGPSEVEQTHREECDAITRTDDTDPRGWQMLLDQGYTGTATRLVPPGCEGAAR